VVSYFVGQDRERDSYQGSGLSNAEGKDYARWASTQNARESVCCQMSGGLAPLIHILYEEEKVNYYRLKAGSLGSD
jgi:hypothetical protein